MHINSLAPVLSATSSRVCIWIMATGPALAVVMVLCGDGVAVRYSVRRLRRSSLSAGGSQCRQVDSRRPLSTTRTNFHRFVRDIGRHSTISTLSPACDSFFSSCDGADRLAAEILPVLRDPSPGGESPPGASWPSCHWSRCRLQLYLGMASIPINSLCSLTLPGGRRYVLPHRGRMPSASRRPAGLRRAQLALAARC